MLTHTYFYTLTLTCTHTLHTHSNSHPHHTLTFFTPQMPLIHAHTQALAHAIHACTQAHAHAWKCAPHLIFSGLQALTFMHQIGIAHMDMNWSNVLWNPATCSACVNDFDLAHTITHAPLPCLGTCGMLEWICAHSTKHMPTVLSHYYVAGIWNNIEFYPFMHMYVTVRLLEYTIYISYHRLSLAWTGVGHSEQRRSRCMECGRNAAAEAHSAHVAPRCSDGTVISNFMFLHTQFLTRANGAA